MYQEDKNGTLVLIGHYKIEVAGGAAAPTPFIFVMPHMVNHLMPALSGVSAPQEDLDNAVLWYREAISPVYTKTSDPDDPTLLVYGMLGDGNCYWHSWAFLLAILSHPWRPRDDALAHDCLGIHRGSKNTSVKWLNDFWRRQSPSRLVGSEGPICRIFIVYTAVEVGSNSNISNECTLTGHAYGDSNISTIRKVLLAYHDVIGLHRSLIQFAFSALIDVSFSNR